MTMINCNGDAFEVRVDGPEGAPALLLSNSLSSDLSMWDDQVPSWSKHFRVIRYNARGQGGSVIDPVPYDMDRLGGDAVAILDALDVPRVHVCGLSMGGMVTQWLLTHAPHRIDRAVLANTASYMGPASLWDDRIALARTHGMEATVEPTVRRWFPPAFHAAAPATIDRMRAMIRRTPPEGYAASCAAIRDMDQRDTIKAATAPTLIVIGANDPATTPADGLAIHAAIRGSRTVTLDAGHISNVEQPEAFIQAVAAFLAG